MADGTSVLTLHPFLTSPSRHPGGMRWRELPTLAALAIAVGWTTPSHGSCKSPLVTDELRALDRAADDDPIRTIAATRERLEGNAYTDPLYVASLYAIIADASETTDDDAGAQAAAQAALAILSRLPGSAENDALKRRLLIAVADAAESPGDMQSSYDRLSAFLDRGGGTASDLACALIVRSRVAGALNLNDIAASDAVRAYHLTRGGDPSAAAEAASGLALVYRGAGLFGDAFRLDGEAVALARGSHLRGTLANALYSHVDSLIALGRFPEALAEGEELERIGHDLEDPIGVAFAARQRCIALGHLSRWGEARAECDAARLAFHTRGRDDQAAAVSLQAAAVDVAAGHPGAALATLDPLLRDETLLSPADRRDAYRTRAMAFEGLGHTAAAYRDLAQFATLSDQADQRSRRLVAAVMEAQDQAGRLARQTTALRSQVADERLREAHQSALLGRLLAIVGLVAIVSVLLTYLFHRSRRLAARLSAINSSLQMQAQVLDAIAEGVLVTDADNKVTYANSAALRMLDQTHEGVVGAAAAALGLGQEIPTDAARAGVTSQRCLDQEVALPIGTGAQRILSVRCAPVHLDAQRGVLWLLRDVTARRRLEEHLLAADTHERVSLGGKIHEDICQDLVAVGMLLSAHRRQCDPYPSLAGDSLAEIHRHLAEAVRKNRAVAQLLAPIAAASGSLAWAIRDLCEELSTAHQLAIRCMAPDDLPSLAAAASDRLFRLARTALEQALRVRPDRIDVYCASDGGTLELILKAPAATGWSAEPADIELRAMSDLVAQMLGGRAEFSTVGDTTLVGRLAMPCSAPTGVAVTTAVSA